MDLCPLLIRHQVRCSHGLGYALTSIRPLNKYHAPNMPFAVVYNSFDNARHFALVNDAPSMPVAENASGLLL